MEWEVALALGCVCFWIGLRKGRGSAFSSIKQMMFRYDAGRAEDRAAFLYVASRELANLLVWKGPDKYVSLYKYLLAETSAYTSWKPEALQQKYDEISKRYPQYSSFDVLDVRP